MPDTSSETCQCRVLILGAYGLIGSGITRRLKKDGNSVIGLGRNAATARSVLPEIRWVIRDLRQLCESDSWGPLLENVDVVVNCAGALQDGADDDLEIVHLKAVTALSMACCKADVGLIQISAIGVSAEASTVFMRSKSAGDVAVKNAGIRYWILRPGLVLAPTAYGGSLLLRMLAAFPLLQPLAYPESRIQTVALADIENAVSMIVQGHIPAGTECDLVENQPHTLRDIVRAQRNWLGFRPAKPEIIAPHWLLWLTSNAADALGVLGWRSPARRSAIQVLSEGLIGDPKIWNEMEMPRLLELEATLESVPATAEDRLFARMALLMPVMVAVLFVFWLFSGLVGLWNIENAAHLLTDAGWPPALATASVVFWSAIDIAIALTLLVRKYSRLSCMAMIAVSAVYLIFATLTVPWLWSDPLGPLLKILPGMMLALVTRVSLETR